MFIHDCRFNYFTFFCSVDPESMAFTRCTATVYVSGVLAAFSEVCNNFMYRNIIIMLNFLTAIRTVMFPGGRPINVGAIPSRPHGRSIA